MCAGAAASIGLRGDGLGAAWHDALMWQGVLWYIAVPATWLIPAGMLADHYMSRFGATAVALIHVVGGVIAFMVWLVGLTLFALVTNQPLGGPFAIVLVVFIPPWMLIGFVVAWAVPGSFPRGHGLMLDSMRAILRFVRRIGNPVTAS